MTMQERINESFNSILVRLKVKFSTGARTRLSTFQFHTGSIKSEHTQRNKSASNRKFQFHTGSIKSDVWNTVDKR